jgi:hypothetical protein
MDFGENTARRQHDQRSDIGIEADRRFAADAGYHRGGRLFPRTAGTAMG